MVKRFYGTDIALYGLILLQLVFWSFTHTIRPEMEIVPNVPGKNVVKALSLGDEQFYFRMLGMNIQDAGDTFGRFTALKKYDYKKLQQWFFLLDMLDDNSDYIPSLASYYYSQTQNVPDTRYIVDYLDKNYDLHPEKKWWWLSQAVYLANHKLNDKQLALKLAEKLAATPAKNVPMWVRQMPAFIHASLGEKEEAYIIIKNLIDNAKDIDPHELNFMHYFIKDRLQMLEKDTHSQTDANPAEAENAQGHKTKP